MCFMNILHNLIFLEFALWFLNFICKPIDIKSMIRILSPVDEKYLLGDQMCNHLFVWEKKINRDGVVSGDGELLYYK